MGKGRRKRLGRLDEAINAYLQWSEEIASCSEADFLAEHEHLRDLLEPMLAADAMPAQDVTSEKGQADPLRMLGEFELLREVGRGGMGVVFEARQRSLNRKVAVKVLPAHLTLQATAIARFKREAKIAAGLKHKGITQVIAVGSENDVHYFAMEFIDGAPLDRAMAEERARSSEDRAHADTSSPVDFTSNHKKDHDAGTSTGGYTKCVVRLIVQVADALEHAHKVGIIHRDVKPSNILVRPDGTTSLTDFGLAREIGMPSVTLTGEFAGTPYYVSPEQAMANRVDLDHRTDIYSLGATLYELVVLKRPFEGQSTQEILGKIIAKDPPDPHKQRPGLSKDLSSIILKAMEKDPDQRYETAAALAEDLRRYLSDHPVHAQAISRLQRWWRWARREPALAGALSAALISLSLGLGFSLSLYHEARGNAARASDNLERFQLVANVVRLRQAVAAEQGLYPAWPERVDAMTDWLGTHADPLIAELDSLRASLVEVSERASAGNVAGLADKFLDETLTSLVRDLEAFADDTKGPVAGVRKRLAWAKSIRRRSYEKYREEWGEAILAIEKSDGQGASSAYAGMQIKPQVGLVPLGPDPDTKFQEFAHLASGEMAIRDSKTGQLEMTEETGLVFVLVPATSFLMGAQSKDRDLPAYDVSAVEYEGPPHRVSLHPLLLSKYEMTQGQWKRLTEGDVPSFYKPTATVGGSEITWANPVELISWSSCHELLRRFGLTLPTEAQWEACCRAGSQTSYSTGAEARSLQGHANVSDRSSGDYLSEIKYDDFLDDGHLGHSPVGSFSANAFGFHDMHGNVWEWTLDHGGSYELPFAPGTGLRLTESGNRRIARGGSYYRTSVLCRSSVRGLFRDSSQFNTLGLRPARVIQK